MPTYITKNSQGVYHFRARIPYDLVSHYNQRFFKKSLQTSHRPTAIKKARKLAVVLQEDFERLRLHRYHVGQYMAKRKGSTFKTGWVDSLFSRADFGGDKDPEAKRSEEALHMRELEFAAQYPDVAEKLIRAKGLAGVESAPQRQTPTLLDAMHEFHEIQSKRGVKAAIEAVSPQSPWGRYTQPFKIILGAIGNKSVGDIGMDDLRRLQVVQTRFPDAARKRGKELMAFDFESGKFCTDVDSVLKATREEGLKLLGKGSLDLYRKHTKTLFLWLYEATYLDPEVGRRVARFFRAENLLTTEDNEDAGGHEPFEIAELNAVFRRWAYSDGVERGYRPQDYFVGLIALYSGARGREACQLWVDDILEVDGVWCFRFAHNKKRGQETKTKRTRTVPIHSKLKALGILDFHAEAKARGGDYLFPDLWQGLAKDRTPFTSFGSKFNSGALAGFEKSFHSFRSTFNSELDLQDVNEERREQILGHAPQSTNRKNYTKPLPMDKLAEVVNKARFDGLDISHLSWGWFREHKLAP